VKDVLRGWEEALETIEAAVPAFAVLAASLSVEELIVRDGDFGGVAVRSEVDGYEGVGFGAPLPPPGVDQFAGRVDEPVRPEDVMDVTALVGDGDAVLVADAEIDAGFGGVVVGGGEPLAELVGVGPRLEDAFDGGWVSAGDYERRRCLDGCLRHAWFSCGLGLVCSRNLPRLSSWFSQKTRYMESQSAACCMGATVRRHIRTRPVFFCSMRPACSST
jgi:hypothetical protein